MPVQVGRSSFGRLPAIRRKRGSCSETCGELPARCFSSPGSARFPRRRAICNQIGKIAGQALILGIWDPEPSHGVVLSGVSRGEGGRSKRGHPGYQARTGIWSRKSRGRTPDGTESIQFSVKLIALDALLTAASGSFRKRASTLPAGDTRHPRAGCTKQVLRVCLRPFRDEDCDGAPSRPRTSSRTFRRRFKGTARPCWRSWARGESTPTGANTGDAPPVGLVRTFRSAAGQPAVRKAPVIVWHRPGYRALVQSNGRGQAGRVWRKRASRDQSPTSVDGLQHAQNTRPLLPQLGAGTERTVRPSFRSFASRSSVNEVIRLPPGEAEFGSAGVQPDQEYPGRRRTEVRAPEEPRTSGAFSWPHRSPESCLQNAR